MNLTEVRIENYKSIDKLSFPIKKYGTGRNASFLTVLLGKNETGKSNVLDALGVLENPEKEYNFLNLKNQNVKDADTVSVFYTGVPENQGVYREYLESVIDIPADVLQKVIIEEAVLEMWLQSENKTFGQEWFYKLKKFSVESLVFKHETDTKLKIAHKKDLSDEEQGEFEQLVWDDFVDIVSDLLDAYFSKNELPKVSIWKPSDDYLIKDEISLTEFAENPEINKPLRNIFFLLGCNNKDAIREKINAAKGQINYRHRLAEELAGAATDYLNTKWGEHAISIYVDISSDLKISVSVKDNGNRFGYFSMADRSQGFKQFVSLLLSISALNETGRLKNHLILIDEPEIHLHPSGVRWLLKNLIEIGANNYLFVSTHSNFILDESTHERHYLLSKEKNSSTSLKHIESDDDIYGDELLMEAFGINVLNDFMSPYRLLVEGASDCQLLTKVFSLIADAQNIRITNGRGGKLPGIASIMNYRHVCPVIVVDDDDEGKSMKTEIINKIKGGFTDRNVFTIRDINGNIIKDGTIEDCLSKDFVESNANQIMRNFRLECVVLDTNSPFCTQIQKHLFDNIQEVDVPDEFGKNRKGRKIYVDNIMQIIKTEIANRFEPTDCETEAPELFELAKGIIEKIKG